MSDLISIVSTLYNYKRYVGELIESVISQMYINWELIIVDDHSTDNPYEIIRTYKDDRIRYICLDKNMGYSYAKNEGIINSRGQYIVMIDADDILTKNSIGDRYYILSDSSSLWCHGGAKEICPNKLISTKKFEGRKRKRREFIRTHDITKEYHHRLIHAQTVMVKKEFHEKMGLYDESLRFSSDNEMFRRAIRFGVIPCYCEGCVALYRRHPKQMSMSRKKILVVKSIKKKILKSVEKRYREGITESNTRLLGKVDNENII